MLTLFFLTHPFNFFTDSPTEVVAAFTEFIKAFDKVDERVSSLVKSRNDALIELLKKGDKSIDEIERIVTLVDKGLKIEVESKDKSNNQKIKTIGGWRYCFNCIRSFYR
jgi:hypothetical protein